MIGEMKGLRNGIILGAVLLVGGSPAAAAAAQPPASPDGRLSNERTLTQWANPRAAAAVRHRPSKGSAPFTNLAPRTEESLPNIYLLLRAKTDASGHQWIQVRLPMRPNGQTGWVPRSALGSFHTVDAELVVHRGSLRAVLFVKGKRAWQARIGVGAPESPTPAGRFWVREKLVSDDPFYGPYAIGTSGYSSLSDWPGGGVVGIHGTSEPQLIPGRPSHGCVRLRNQAITRLVELLPLGTPVRIL
jgi:hypothetical protein